ncbi:G-type lectin S-receptor-like serine/threonine-protein kinase LECRK1 isoform X2 [Panicum virgatum]|uniref:G-type lectin S-receptor-like serine/threonine-protein kinase LECRK1 isoform X2 n=1 Tax=Panicum virgatum TaxID=38727 RepID=UPI0019D6154C|nr:G-type lectin S-receptor-like serine/threonine-protein kinase LECRK1 isoform X2 [Panicum virgatum]
MRLLVPDGARRQRLLQCEARAPPPPAPPAAAGGGGGGGGRTVVVGIRRDAASRELLTWALVKVANAGDRVVALHVAAQHVAAAADGLLMGLDERSRAADSLSSVLAIYDGFCNLKQINLELKVCGGSSIRKTLVKEAASCGAAHLILGVAKNSRSSSTSVAKYCSKRVPAGCSVLAVNNGKVVYHKDAGHGMLPELYQSTIPETPRRSYRKLLSSMIGEKLWEEHGKDNRSISRAITMPMRSPALPKEVSLALVPVKGCRRESQEVATGWPLLRKKFLPDRKASLPDKSKMSVVQWAMRLPSRYSAVSPVHSECNRTTRPDSMSTSHILRDRVVVPLRSNSGKSSVVIEELEKETPEELTLLKEKFPSIYSSFSYRELAKITSNFSTECVIGEGGTSHVYRGCLANGRELAVKILKYSDEVLKEFVSEIEIVSSLRHKNVISLISFCFENDDLLLVYEYLQRGSLEEILHGEKGCKNIFGWTERFSVAVGVAHALDYLHGNDNSHQVIHRDVKSSNILISDCFEPKLSDFGLAVWAADVTSQMTCNDVAGTFGYLAPEYFMHGKVNNKIDVYAFGVVLLELISGRKPLCTGCPKGQESLVMWANSIIQGGKLAQLVDPNLPTEGRSDEVERMTLAASLCIRQAPQNRPQIDVVLKLLKGDIDILKWARSQVGLSYEVDADECVMTPPVKGSNANIQSYINLAFDVDDDSASVTSTDFIAANTSLEEYLKGRWSRSSSFD